MSQPRKFSAKYVGQCPECGKPWLPGDEIAYAEDTLVCLSCAYDILTSVEYEDRWSENTEDQI